MYWDYKLVEKTKELHVLELISKVREKEKRLRNCIVFFWFETYFFDIKKVMSNIKYTKVRWTDRFLIYVVLDIPKALMMCISDQF